MVSEKDKMLSANWYNPMDKQLSTEREHSRRLQKQYNDTSVDEPELRKTLLRAWLPNASKLLWIEPPFYCDYGYNLFIGKKVFFNFNCIALDVAPIYIGNNVFLGPNVQLYTVNHPLNAALRKTLIEQAKPITIADDVWIGGSVIILPGVTIGAGSVIAAGSVVTKDIPPNVLAAGNPCKVIKNIDDEHDDTKPLP